MDILIFILSLAGAMAWIPYILEKVNKPKVFCIIKKYTWSEDVQVSYCVPFDKRKDIKKGSLITLDTSITCINNDLYYKNIEVKIKYKSDEKVYIGEVVIIKSISEPNLNTSREFNFYDNILSKSVILKEKSFDAQIMILVNINRNDIEYIDLAFIRTNGKKAELRLGIEDFYGKENTMYTIK